MRRDDPTWRALLGSLMIATLALSSGCRGPKDTVDALSGPADTSALTISRDVLIYGGTPSGLTAAITLARLGKSVIVLEPTSWWGGMVAGGLSLTDSGTSSVITGITLDFFHRTNALELANGAGPIGPYVVEPHIARDVFRTMLHEAGVIVKTEERVVAVRSSGTVIESVTMSDGADYVAKQFIDASYEGDLMAAAGVTYTWGRESAAQYNEPEAGVMAPFAVFSGAIDPYRTPGDPTSGLLPFVSPSPPGPVGSADTKVMAYNFRLCATDVAGHGDNAVPYSQLKPATYDPSMFLGAQRIVDYLTRNPGYDPSSVGGWFFHPAASPYAAGKYDVNGLGTYSTDVVEVVNGYPDGDSNAREMARRTISDYDQGLLYYLATDAHVPEDVRGYMSKYGACKDEFVDNQYFPYQLYIREGRRMVGSYVVTEQDVLNETSVPDPIAMGGYRMDSHYRQYFDHGGQLWYEGTSLGAASDPYTRTGKTPGAPFPISYGALTPRSSEKTNLLVSVTVSASSMAYRAIRMEPQYMMMGAAAGTAASLAIDAGTAVQALSYDALKHALAEQGQLLLLPGDCLFGGAAVANGATVTAWLHLTVQPPITCKSTQLTCRNGALTGDTTYKYPSCTVL